MTTPPTSTSFFGWRVMWAAFVLAAFGWGFGFYSPPIFLHAVTERTGWPVDEVSVAITVHFLSGALVVANLPRLARSFGIARVVALGVVLVASGMLGWSLAVERWQLFASAMATGAGWVTMSAAGINAILAPWFDKRRPVALSMAYNGAGIGGALVAPTWAFLIPAIGFTNAAALLGGVGVIVVWMLAARYFSVTPAGRGQFIDGMAAAEATLAQGGGRNPARNAASLWRSPAFLTLAGGMALGLFAQVGLVSHLFSMLVPTVGLRGAGLTMGAATAMSIAGRMFVVWLMPPGSDRRIYLSLSYCIQIIGSLLFLWFADGSAVIAVAATLLFGFGIGNVTSMPPLIAQIEFSGGDVLRVVSLIVALSQATSAFAPTIFGLVREWAIASGIGLNPEYAVLFTLVTLVQVSAIVSLLAGRGSSRAAAA